MFGLSEFLFVLGHLVELLGGVIFWVLFVVVGIVFVLDIIGKGSKREAFQAGPISTMGMILICGILVVGMLFGGLGHLVLFFGDVQIHPIMIYFFLYLMSWVFFVYKSLRHKKENKHWWVLPLILSVVCFLHWLLIFVVCALQVILLGVTGGNEVAAIGILFVSVAFFIFILKSIFGGHNNSTQVNNTQQSSGYSGAGGAGFYKPYTEAPFIEKYANKNIYEGELYDSYSFRQATGRIGKYGGVYDTTKGYDRTAGSFDERGNVDSMDRTDLGDSTFVKKVANGDIGNIDSFGNIYDKYDRNRKIGSIDENGYIYEGDGLTRKQVGRID
jgi:hypothetical protein